MESTAIATMNLTRFTKQYYAVFYGDSVIIAYIEKSVRKEHEKTIKRLIKGKKSNFSSVVSFLLNIGKLMKMD